MKKRIIMANGEDAPKKSVQSPSARGDRLRENLRENLKKRKAQKRQQKEARADHGQN